LSVVLYGCEAWYLTLREKCRIRAFENRIIRRIMDARELRIGSGEGFLMKNFIVCTVHLI